MKSYFDIYHQHQEKNKMKLHKNLKRKKQLKI